jgi:hypothetical protein
MKRFLFLSATIFVSLQMMAGSLGNINETTWHDGFAYYHAIEKENGVIEFQGGTLHEGGYCFNVVKGRGGKMVAMSYYEDYESLTTSGNSVSGSSIERRTINGQDMLLITSPEGVLTDVLLAVNEDFSYVIEGQMNKILDGVYTDGKGNTFSFDGFGKMSVKGAKTGKWDSYNYIYMDESPSNMFEYLPLNKHYSFKLEGQDLKLSEVETRKGKSWEDDDLDLVTLKTFKLKKSNGMRYSGKGLWPITSEEVLTSGYLYFYDIESLRLMRNDIYARHGYIFKDKALQKVFKGQSWYKPVTSNASSLKFSEIERINIALIQNMEKIKANF